MIPRTTPRPHICLSCQRRLARQSPPSKIQAAFQSSISGAEDKPNPQTRRTLVPLSHFKQSKQPTPAFLRYRPVEEKPGETFGFRGHALIKERESLKHQNNLGDPANVIVLRESKIRRYDHSGWKAAEEDDIKDVAAEHIDILAQVNDERGLIDQAEVEKNINEFKPDAGREPQNWDEFNQLVQRLQRAFTTPQLEWYISSFKSIQASEPTDTVAWTPSSSSSMEGNMYVIENSPWIPEAEEFDGQGIQEASRGYALASHTSKQRVVIRVLRECWNLSIPELESGIGSMAVEMPIAALNLLMKHNVLDAMKEDFLPRHTEILKAFPETGVVRITASRRSCDIIVNQLNWVLENVRSLKLSLVDLMPPVEERKNRFRKTDRWADRNFDDEALFELGRMTNTTITRVPHRNLPGRNLPAKELLIFCLTSKQDVWLSNRSSVARRLLVTSGNFSTRQRYQLGYKMPEYISTVQTGIFSDYSIIEGLSWRERLRRWTRWTIPIPKDSPPISTPVVTAPGEPVADQKVADQEQKKAPKEKKLTHKQKKINKKIEKANAVKTPELPTLEGLTYWDDNYETASSAMFGSILHSHPTSKLKDTPKTPLDVKEPIRTFCTALPNLSSALQECQLSPRDAPNEVLILHFQPNPFSKPSDADSSIGALALSAFPPLEMHFHVDAATKALKLESIQAVVREEGTDLMLPSQAVDLRFHQKTTSHLLARWLESKHIKDFLAASNLTYEGRRLDLPPTLKMRIASHLCDGPSLGKLNMNPATPVHDVEYLFVGREAKRSLIFHYHDWKVEYTDIDGGRTGGRRSELRLRPICIARKGTQEEFLKSVYNLSESFGTGTIVPAATRKVWAQDNLTRMVTLGTEKNHRPVQKLFTHGAKRVQVVDNAVDEWWDQVQDGRETNVEEGETIATKDGAAAEDDPAALASTESVTNADDGVTAQTDLENDAIPEVEDASTPPDQQTPESAAHFEKEE